MWRGFASMDKPTEHFDGSMQGSMGLQLLSVSLCPGQALGALPGLADCDPELLLPIVLVQPATCAVRRRHVEEALVSLPAMALPQQLALRDRRFDL